MKIDLRKPTEEDLARFRECLVADPDHTSQDPDEWLAGPSEMLVFYDTKGNRVWIRIERVLRVSLQHDPRCSKAATASILYKAFHWLVGSARQSMFTEIVFESRAHRLIQFLQKLFGVKPLEENFHLRT
jgi:hypothetical protein